MNYKGDGEKTQHLWMRGHNTTMLLPLLLPAEYVPLHSL